MHPIMLKRTDSGDPDFISLVRRLDAELAVRDGDDHAFYAQFNKITHIRTAIVAYQDGHAVGCGAIRPLEDQVMEVKRMFVLPEYRGKGIAAQILSELERWAKELNAGACCLETGMNQPEAIALYRKSGYASIPNYGPYAGVTNSVCFRKTLG